MANFSIIIILSLCLGLVFLGLIGGGIYLIVRSRRDKQKAASSLAWPSVLGRVVESRVEESRSTDSEGDVSITYRPYVRYEYTLQDQTYSGDKLYVGLVGSSSNRRKAEETASQYPAGSAVTVYYNPQDPQDAVLQQKTGGNSALIIGIALLVMGVLGGCIGVIVLAVSVFSIN